MIYCPICEPGYYPGWFALHCTECAGKIDTPAYLLAMGANDAVLESDLVAKGVSK